MPIRDLAAHDSHFVTVAELAEYWAVSRQQIYKCIESGALAAIRLGSRLYRVRTQTALEYERSISTAGSASNEMRPQSSNPVRTSPSRPSTGVGPQRVVRRFGTD